VAARIWRLTAGARSSDSICDCIAYVDADANALPDKVLVDLDDWLSTTLLEEIDRQEAELFGSVADAP
jgi:hypothetical protein